MPRPVAKASQAKSTAHSLARLLSRQLHQLFSQFGVVIRSRPGNMARSRAAALCLSRSACATRDYPYLGTICVPHLRLTLSGEDL